jgi:hypothetical protein
MNLPRFNSQRMGRWVILPLVIVGLVLSYAVPHDPEWVHALNNTIFGVVIAWAYARLVG